MAQRLFTCPHCDEAGIRFWAKYWARPHDPATCQHCDKASSISDRVETASTWLYFIAGFFGLTVLMMQAMGSSESRADAAHPIWILISLLLFYFAIEAAKVFWVPLKAFSNQEVENRKSTSNKIAIGIAIILLSAMLLEQCGF